MWSNWDNLQSRGICKKSKFTCLNSQIYQPYLHIIPINRSVRVFGLYFSQGNKCVTYWLKQRQVWTQVKWPGLSQASNKGAQTNFVFRLYPCISHGKWTRNLFISRALQVFSPAATFCRRHVAGWVFFFSGLIYDRVDKFCIWEVFFYN